MILRELDNYKNQLRNLETDKAQALRDLQMAIKTVEELTNKLEMLSESKQAAISTTEATKSRAKVLEEKKSMKERLGNGAWKLDVDAERELYKASSAELISCKQELTNLRQDFDAALEAKLSASQKAEEAHQSAKVNQDTRKQLMNEVAKLRETLEQVKLASLQAEEDHLKLVAEKEVHFLVHKSAKEVAEQDIQRMKEEYNPEENLEHKFEEVTEAIKVLQEQLTGVRTSDMYSLQGVLMELENAKKELQAAVAEENSIRSYVDGLRQQVEEVKSKISESHRLALETESKIDKLRDELVIKKNQLNAALSMNAVAEMRANLEKLIAETDKNTREADKIMTEVEVQRQDAEAAMARSKQLEEKLCIAIQEAKEAKAAEKRADERIYDSPRSGRGGRRGAGVKELGSARSIKLTVENFKAVTQKIEDCRKEADAKVVALTAQLQATRAREKETLEKVEEMVKECESIESDIEDVMKEAQVAEAAKEVVESELRKLRMETSSASSSATSYQKETMS